MAAATVVLAVAWPAHAAPAGPIVRDGKARFQVLSPTLIRLEYAADGRFEDRPTLVARARRGGHTFTTRVVGDHRVIRTSRLTLRYRRGSGPFGPGNLELLVRVGGTPMSIRPSFPPPPGPPPQPPSPPARTQAPPTPDPDPSPRTRGNLGGWARGVDDQEGPIPLHDGLLSRDGWYLLDDSRSALITRGSPGFATRPEREGAYQDGYLFGYGHRYARGLRDLRRLSGAAPLLPRKAFGNWYSKYWPYSGADYRALIPRFRSERVPLDVLAIDTDFKAPSSRGAALANGVLGRDPSFPYSWNGWDWNTDLVGQPDELMDYLHSSGLEVGLNIHPSIGDRDAHWAEAQQRSGGLIPGSTSCRYFQADPIQECGVFDWTDQKHLDTYFGLHEQFERDGADFMWLDWCCDESRAPAAGLTEDTWINSLYAKRSRARGSRWPAFSRIGASYWAYFGDQEPGAFAEHRQTIHFTGDSAATWEMLDFQPLFTAAEGNIGLPYVSHDIGSFKGKHLDDDMYVRWLQLGAFQPINRLHSNHGDRLPWEYTGSTARIATRFLRLRGALIPYLYTLARRSHDSGLPMVRGMYLRYPGRDAAYTYDRQYMLGDDLLVAPVGSPGDPARKTVWLPPGRWIDFFTGKAHRGPRVKTFSVPLGRMPVFARAGAVVPLQRYRPHEGRRPPGRLVLRVWGGGDDRFRLYEDRGDGLAYLERSFAFTPIVHDDRGKAGSVVRIGRARGSFRGRRARRRWELRLIGVRRPGSVTVNGHAANHSYRKAARTLVIHTGRVSTAKPLRIVTTP